MAALISAAGTKNLDEQEKATINRLLDRHLKKIAVKAKKLDSVVIHVKTYRKKGKRKKYSIHIRTMLGKSVFESENACDWDLTKAVIKAVNEVTSQIRKKFRE